jgi:hypothetical protein
MEQELLPRPEHMCSSSVSSGVRVAQSLLTCSYIRIHEADFIHFSRKKKLARSFNLTFGCIDDVLSLNNSKFNDCVNRIYPIDLEIKGTR